MWCAGSVGNVVEARGPTLIHIEHHSGTYTDPDKGISQLIGLDVRAVGEDHCSVSQFTEGGPVRRGDPTIGLTPRRVALTGVRLCAAMPDQWWQVLSDDLKATGRIDRVIPDPYGDSARSRDI